MEERFYSCELLSDVVLNSRLATEGNMTTLDYIPGSNFLGVVAGGLYNKISPELAYRLFHSGDVSFGDGLLADGICESYKLPLSLMTAKDSANENEMYLHFLLTKNGIGKQLKQSRVGYFTASGEILDSTSKTFALKSAHDVVERRSKEGAMFGFESIRKGQTFIFSVRSMEGALLDQIENALIGIKSIGKSKTAQYGQVRIAKSDNPLKRVEIAKLDNYTLVYAQSNLCFFDTNGQPTLQPTEAQLGIANGKIDWTKSQIRSYSYSPWNGIRNTTNTQRICIAMGSVFYIDGANVGGFSSVGEYQADGLGRIITNPAFLNGDPSTGSTQFFKPASNKERKSSNLNANTATTALGQYLLRQKDVLHKELVLAAAVQKELSSISNLKMIKNISRSQWGAIRSFASYATDISDLKGKLFDGKNGFLTHGVAYDKYWGANRESYLKRFKEVFETNAQFGTHFIAKFAAEAAKK